MSNLSYQLTPELPEDVLRYFENHEDGVPIAYDYECAILERMTPRGYVYTAVNKKTGRKMKICSRRDLPYDSDVKDMLFFVGNTDIAGAGRLQADRIIGEEINAEKATEIMDAVLYSILPENSIYYDDEQKGFARDILDTIVCREVMFSECEPNLPNVQCCLIAAIIAKRGRMNDYHARGMYPKMQYADMPKTPIVISVPSLPMQRDIARVQIPKIIKILLDGGVIRETLTITERKGRENYVCARKAINYRINIRHRNRQKKMDKMLEGDAVIELNDNRWLTNEERQAISVDGSCTGTYLASCSPKIKCNYNEYLRAASSYLFDIQVCTHGCFLNDLFKRIDGQRHTPIPNYQSLIICDAGDYLQTAALMQRIRISCNTVAGTAREISNMKYRRNGLEDIARETAKKLSGENKRLFKWHVTNTKPADEIYEGEDAYSIVTLSEDSILRHLKNIHNITERLIYILYKEAFYAKAEELLAWVNIKYAADITKIDLNKLLPDGEDTKMQVDRLYNTVCNLKGVKKFIAAEQPRKQQKRHDISTARKSYAKYSYNTEREAITKTRSEIEELIREYSNRLLEKNVSTGTRSSYIHGIIKVLIDIRDKTGKIVKNGGYSCRVRIESEDSCMYATPNNLEDTLFSYQMERKIPTIVMPGMRPEETGNDTKNAI